MEQQRRPASVPRQIRKRFVPNRLNLPKNDMVIRIIQEIIQCSPNAFFPEVVDSHAFSGDDCTRLIEEELRFLANVHLISEISGLYADTGQILLQVIFSEHAALILCKLADNIKLLLVASRATLKHEPCR